MAAPGNPETQEPGKRRRQKRPRRTELPAYSPEFEQAWAAYPRKEAKIDAFLQWRARLQKGRLPDGTPLTPDMLRQAAAHYAEDCHVRGTEPRFIMLAKTFFGPHYRFADYLRPARDAPTEASPFLEGLRRMRRGELSTGGGSSEPESGEAIRN